MYFFSTVRIITLITLIGAAPLHASSPFSVALCPLGGVPVEIPLLGCGPKPFNVLTGRPLSKNGHGKKLSDVLEDAKNSPSKKALLRIFRDSYTGALEVSDGSNEQGLSNFSLVATYHLVFGETDVIITPHFEPLTPPSPTHHIATPYYSAPQHPHPRQWYPVSPQYYQQPLSLFNPYAVQQQYQHPLYRAPFPTSYQQPAQPLIQQRNFQGPSIRTLQIRLHDLHTKLLETGRKSLEQDTLLQQQLREKETLLKKIAELEQTLQQQAVAGNLASASSSPARTPSDSTEPTEEHSPRTPSSPATLLNPVSITVTTAPIGSSHEITAPRFVEVTDHRKNKKQPSAVNPIKRPELATAAPTPAPVLPKQKDLPSSPPEADPHDEVTVVLSESIRSALPPQENKDAIPHDVHGTAESLSVSAPTASTSYEPPKHRNRKKGKDKAPEKKKEPQNPLIVVRVDEEESDYAREETTVDVLTAAHTREEERAKQRRTQEEAERNRLRKKKQEDEKATHIALWQEVESTCAAKQFSEAFTVIKKLDRRNPLYVKGLFEIIRTLNKTDPEESYPEIIEAARALSKAKTPRQEFTDDRRLLIEFLLKHSSEEDKEEFLEEAMNLGNLLAGTHWHFLQMKKATEPCGKKSCAHRKALQFFSSQSDNAVLRTHVPRYFALIKAATQCTQQKDVLSIIRTLMAQAQSSGLSDADIQNIALHLPDEYKEAPIVTTPAASRKPAPLTAQEKFELCKTTALAAIERGDLQAAKDATVVFIDEQKETNTLNKIVTCLAEGLATVNAQSTTALQLTTLICIETIINAFRNELPLGHLEILRQIFEKIPMKETHSSETRAEKCLAQLQLQLSHILNRFFIQLAYLQADFHQAKNPTKKQRILDKKLTALLNEAQTPADACRIMQSLINYKTDDENGFSRQVETFVGTFIDQHPEKKEIWQRSIVNPQKNFPNWLKSLYEEFEKRQGTVPKAQLIYVEAPKIFKEITTREDAEHCMQALNYYSSNDVFSFFGLTVTFFRGKISEDKSAQELWQNLLPAEKSSRWCTLL